MFRKYPVIISRHSKTIKAVRSIFFGSYLSLARFRLHHQNPSFSFQPSRCDSPVPLSNVLEHQIDVKGTGCLPSSSGQDELDYAFVVPQSSVSVLQ